jgi:hypothetical protein
MGNSKRIRYKAGCNPDFDKYIEKRIKTLNDRLQYVSKSANTMNGITNETL